MDRKTASRKHPSVEAWDAVNGMDVDECVDEAEGSGVPNSQRLEPWADKNDTEYDDDQIDPDMLTRKYKTLCHEDIRFWIVRNPTPGERDVPGMGITFARHKGVYREPKPCVPPRFLNLTTSVRLSSFMKKAVPYFALPAMSWLWR